MNSDGNGTCTPLVSNPSKCCVECTDSIIREPDCAVDHDNPVTVHFENQTGRNLTVRSRFTVDNGVIYDYSGNAIAYSCKEN